MQRIRIHYSKGEALQYVGNLDLHKIWERTFRRAMIPLAYSQGFHPQPRMHQACPLPLGFTSKAELLDFWCESEDSLDSIQSKLMRTVQPGIEIHYLSSIPLTSAPLQTIVESVVYMVSLPDDLDISELPEQIDQLNKTNQIIRERRGKKYDLKPLIKELIYNPGDPSHLLMRLSSLPGATGRPEEVLEELGISSYSVDVERVELSLFEKNNSPTQAAD